MNIFSTIEGFHSKVVKKIKFTVVTYWFFVVKSFRYVMLISRRHNIPRVNAE